jgi:hypothetical protein
MTKNEQLVQALCFPHCIYYKPGKNEEYLCRGAVVVERLLQAGKPIETGRPAEILATVTDALLVDLLCTVCDFHEQDCDFMQDRTATPCGGFLLLGQLLSSGVITTEDIR